MIKLDNIIVDLDKADDSITKLEEQLQAATQGKGDMKSELDKANTQNTKSRISPSTNSAKKLL